MLTLARIYDFYPIHLLLQYNWWKILQHITTFSLDAYYYWPLVHTDILSTIREFHSGAVPSTLKEYILFSFSYSSSHSRDFFSPKEKWITKKSVILTKKKKEPVQYLSEIFLKISSEEIFSFLAFWSKLIQFSKHFRSNCLHTRTHPSFSSYNSW